MLVPPPPVEPTIAETPRGNQNNRRNRTDNVINNLLREIFRPNN